MDKGSVFVFDNYINYLSYYDKKSKDTPGFMKTCIVLH